MYCIVLAVSWRHNLNFLAGNLGIKDKNCDFDQKANTTSFEVYIREWFICFLIEYPFEGKRMCP